MTAIPVAARLPKQNENHDTLAELPVGMSGWTVPWAMESYGPNGCYLSADYHYWPGQHGTVQMLVEHREDGYHVWIKAGEKYDLRHGFPSNDAIPVASINHQ